MAVIYKRNPASTLEEIEANRPEYQSDYQSQINELYQQIANRPAFQYHYNADPLYQQYKQQYLYNGERANRDAQAASAQLTGGYGNSYGVTAGSQAQQVYNNQLNAALLDLTNAAYSRYQDEGNRMDTRLSQLQGLENADYGRYQDALSAWQADRNYAYNAYMDQLALAMRSSSGSGGGDRTTPVDMDQAFQVGAALETADERKAYVNNLLSSKTITQSQADTLTTQFRELSIAGRKTQHQQTMANGGKATDPRKTSTSSFTGKTANTPSKKK